MMFFRLIFGHAAYVELDHLASGARYAVMLRQCHNNVLGWGMMTVLPNAALGFSARRLRDNLLLWREANRKAGRVLCGHGLIIIVFSWTVPIGLIIALTMLGVVAIVGYLAWAYR